MPDAKSSQPSDSTQLSHTETFVADPGTRLPGLTVLYHPSLRRVGERALLADLAAGRPERLSRLEPKFAAPTSNAVAVPVGSRQPSIDHMLNRGQNLQTALSPHITVLTSKNVQRRSITFTGRSEQSPSPTLGPQAASRDQNWVDLGPSRLNQPVIHSYVRATKTIAATSENEPLGHCWE